MGDMDKVTRAPSCWKMRAHRAFTMTPESGRPGDFKAGGVGLTNALQQAHLGSWGRNRKAARLTCSMQCNDFSPHGISGSVWRG